MADTQAQLPVKITDGTVVVAIVGAALKVDGSAVTQPVSGTVTLSSQTVTCVQSTAANLKVDPSSVTSPVSGTVSNVPQEITTGVVTSYSTATTVGIGATGTMSYTVTTGKTFYLKSVIATSGGGPCSVIVDYGAGPTIVAAGFYQPALPFVQIWFDPPVAISSTTVVRVKILNNATGVQDLHSTIMGREV